MAANTTASPSTGNHCRRVNDRSRGRPTASRITPATHWRTATTPTGPITGKASAPMAAPVWLPSELLSINAMPADRRGRPAVRDDGGNGGTRSGVCTGPACGGRSIHKMHVVVRLYAERMDVELRHLRVLATIVDASGFTGAAAELGLSQPAVSRTLAALEDALGVRLLRRTSRELVLTAAGERVLARARRVLAEVDDLVREARGGHGRIRIGHAWAAMGEHTVEFQRRWAARHPDVALHLVRTNTPTGGLAEGACDVAVVRVPVDARDDSRIDGALVGLESRYCALAADDPLARRRQLRLADLTDRVLAVDPRTGTTTLDLWPPEGRPDSRRSTTSTTGWP